ncbi:dihydropteroate synthase [Chlorobium phaeobacteroides]|jgi:dihydropteroate synthase|uniref:Dihydropteroate synthase n=1 Tax=Chlorobium phaeobacteroides (strain DSM 266 / SMG 266 / 2430) TaxID=290317 RepID=A1BDT5_CHLPD|nr:dihydropteroate synthase [Chlorobium phaeobacteroides]ABL64562.1 Dihydropteroate synthase [Chlorobium phaeobacteroides DSM 266]MBV5326538.1 dihydropteroate synthase [Chlorobium sp.]
MKSVTDKPDQYLINCSGVTLDLRKAPVVMGIVNVTPDSFYDGGMFVQKKDKPDYDRALNHALQLIRSGATIIDIGGESSRPGAEPIPTEEEIRRTVPLIGMLRKKTDALISIDTWKSEVAEAAIRAGAQLVNDISGFTFDADLPEICRKYQAAVILMHTPTKPQSMQWSTGTSSTSNDIITTVTAYLQRSILTARHHGINDIIIDPGFGFGKTVEENYRLLGAMNKLQKLQRPLLAGVSRKSFLGHVIAEPRQPTPPPSERLSATLAAETIALLNGASIIRAHDVKAAMQTIAVVMASRAASA